MIGGKIGHYEVTHHLGAGERRLYLRSLEQLDALPLPGTEGGSHPFFSPDGRWVGFFAEGKLKKTSINGGKVLTLAEAPAHRGHAQLAVRNAPGPE